MKKILLLIILISNLFSFDLTSNIKTPDTFSTINSFKENSKKEKFSYDDLIAFLKASNDKNKILILGVLYANDSEKPDDFGKYIKADPILAKKYILQSYKMGNKDALAILSGLILYNDKMSILDKDLSETKKMLIQSEKDGNIKGILLLAITELLRGEYDDGISTLIKAANMNDASAQLELAIIYQKGIYSEKLKKMVISPNRDVAEFYLNQACTNENKSDKVREFCYSPEIIIEKR